MQTKKIINICLIFTAFLVYLVASQIVELGVDLLNIPITQDFWLTWPQVGGALVAVSAFFAVQRNQKSWEFLTEVVNELTKVVYPTRKESGQSAVVVVILVSLATLSLAVFDSVWSFVTQLVLSST